MEDTSMMSMNSPGNIERVFQNECARTLTSCYTIVMVNLIETQGGLKSKQIYSDTTPCKVDDNKQVLSVCLS